LSEKLLNGVSEIEQDYGRPRRFPWLGPERKDEEENVVVAHGFI